MGRERRAGRYRARRYACRRECEHGQADVAKRAVDGTRTGAGEPARVLDAGWVQ